MVHRSSPFSFVKIFHCIVFVHSPMLNEIIFLFCWLSHVGRRNSPQPTVFYRFLGYYKPLLFILSTSYTRLSLLLPYAKRVILLVSAVLQVSGIVWQPFYSGATATVYKNSFDSSSIFCVISFAVDTGSIEYVCKGSKDRDRKKNLCKKVTMEKIRAFLSKTSIIYLPKLL